LIEPKSQGSKNSRIQGVGKVREVEYEDEFEYEDDWGETIARDDCREER